MPSCPNPAERGGKCVEHGRRQERARGSRSKRGYSRRWYRATKLWIAQDPARNFCADPYKVHGAKLEPATETDHIIPHRGDRELFWRESNWARLCHACHSRKTLSGE
jgi:5-methylcytosine-specific restriction protein A